MDANRPLVEVYQRNGTWEVDLTAVLRDRTDVSFEADQVGRLKEPVETLVKCGPHQLTIPVRECITNPGAGYVLGADLVGALS